MRRITPLLVVVIVLAAACASPGQSSPAIPAPGVSVPQVMPANAAVVAASGGDTPSDNSCNGGHPTASLAPEGPLPSPGHMPAGSYMAAIYKNGLRVGVDQNTYLWGYRDPSGELAGFDIDMVDQVAEAIFGPSYYPDHIHYVIVPNADRLSAVANGEVDIVAETLTILCSREQQVSFSTEYFDAAQRVLVPRGSPIKSAADLQGKRVCAASKSDSLTNLANLPHPPILVSVTNQTDCLVMLQQGQVDAISTDDTILQGLAAQDPSLEIVPGLKLSDEPYGMAMSKSHPDFTRFVNAVLAQERSDGEWTAIWERWLGPVLQTKPPAPPQPVYLNQA